jgi:hypothetical protein
MVCDALVADISNEKSSYLADLLIKRPILSIRRLIGGDTGVGNFHFMRELTLLSICTAIRVKPGSFLSRGGLRSITCGVFKIHAFLHERTHLIPACELPG